jgi:hypothetical protein
MNAGVGRARIGEYTRWNKGEIFQAVGYDADARTLETQTFDVDLDDIDFDTRVGLALAFADCFRVAALIRSCVSEGEHAR